MVAVHRLRTFILALIFSMTALATQKLRAGPTNPVPPVAKRIPKEIVAHGDKRVDDYFWLREKTNADVLAYLQAENAYADSVTGPQQPFQESLYQEMLGHLKETDSSAPVRRGEFYYYTSTEKGKN